MHEPPGYECPFCPVAQGHFNKTIIQAADVVMRNALITAFVAPFQWPNNKGHVLIIPNEHFENLYDLPVKFAAPMQLAAQTIAAAMKQAFRCTGISTRQHNEPDGNQDVWHYHMHVFPRFPGDNLYGSVREQILPDERAVQAAQIRELIIP